MHEKLTSLDTRKVYTYVFRPVKSPMRMLFSKISSKVYQFERTRSARCTGHIFVPSVVFLNDRIDSGFLQIFVNICISLRHL